MKHLVSRLASLALPVVLAACGHQHAATHDAEHHHEHHAAASPAEPGGHDMHHSFSGAEEWSKRWDNPERDAWQKPDVVLSLLALAPTAKIADIGAGTGYFTMRFAKATSGTVYGVDIEPDMIRFLGERAAKESVANVIPVKAEPADAKLPEAVDVIFMCNTYHHVDSRSAYFAALKAKLAPKGRVVIVDFKLDSKEGPRREHKLADAVVASELVQAGYTIVSTDTTSLPEQYVIIAEPKG